MTAPKSRTIPPRLLAWGGLGVLFILMIVLNPSAERHREAIRHATDERSPFEHALGLGDFAAFMSRYESIGVASYTTVSDKVKTVGFLGMVFVRD
ncbi:MAG TPA: hypothetical protein VFM34_09555 [Moraxellaceae bacterium]|nr:hypothetical protein [Moraxellaceae bacterium]